MSRRCGRAAALAALSAVAALGALVSCGGGSVRGATAPLDPESAGKPAKVEDLRGDLVSVDVVGISRERLQEARAALGSAVGTPFDRNRVAADTRALFALGSIADVKVEGRPAQGGVALRFRVREQPRVRSLELRGSQVISAAQWQSQIPVKRGDFFDPIRLTAIRRSMLDQLRQAGFLTAKVAWNSTKAQGGGLDVVFTVEEGRLVSVAKLDVLGSKAVPKKALLAMLAQSGTAPGQRYWRDALERGLGRMSDHYFDLGYVNVYVGPVEETLSQDGSQMSLVVPVQEGDQFRLGDLGFEGALAAPKREYAAAFGLRKGQVFSRRKVSEGMERIQKLHQAKGKAGVNLVPVTEVDTKKKRIKVTLQMSEPGAPPPAQGRAPAGAPAGAGRAPAGAAPAQGAPPAAGGAPSPTAPAPAPTAPAPPPASTPPASTPPVNPAPAPTPPPPPK